MPTRMQLEVVGPGKRLPAHVTVKGLLSAVDQQMPLQVVALLK